MPETEFAAARAELALREQDLIDARSEPEKARLRLLRLVSPNSAAGWSHRIEPTVTPRIGAVPLDQVEDRLASALRLRPELNHARLQIERGGLVLPRLDLFVTLGKSGFADSFSGSVEDLGGDSNDVGPGRELRFPNRQMGRRGGIPGALASREQAEVSLRNLAQLVSLDVRTTYVEARRAREQIDASTATRTLQEEVLRAEQAKFRVGESIASAVAQAQRGYMESQIGEI